MYKLFTCGQVFTRTSEWQNFCGNFNFYKINRTLQKAFVLNKYLFEYSFIWMSKSLFNFVRLIFRSSTTSRSRRFCGRWLYRIMTVLLAEIMQPILLNTCLFFKKDFYWYKFSGGQTMLEKIHPISWYCTWSLLFDYPFFWVKNFFVQKL